MKTSGTPQQFGEVVLKHQPVVRAFAPGRNLYLFKFHISMSSMKIEITSWKARAYGIFTRVGEVSESERVRFLILHQRV